MMCRKGKDFPWVKYLANNLQYIQPVVTLWTCVLILDAIFFLFFGICFCDYDFSFVFTKNVCFRCALCGNVTLFYQLSLNKTVQNPSWKRKVCHEFINVMLDKNWLHKSGVKSTLYNLSMRGLSLSSLIFIWYFLFPNCDRIPIYNVDIFLCFQKRALYEIRNIWCHEASRTWV